MMGLRVDVAELEKCLPWMRKSLGLTTNMDKTGMVVHACFGEVETRVSQFEELSKMKLYTP